MEQLANFLASTTLNMGSTLNNSATVLTLTSIASPIPSAFPFRIRIDDELMKVTGTPGSNQLTVVRGDGGTTAASHVDGASVQVVLTKESLDALIAILASGTEISTRRAINFTGATVTDDPGNSRVNVAITGGYPDEASLVDPTGISVTWHNQGSAALTVNTTQKSIFFSCQNTNSGVDWHWASRTAPGTTFTWIVRCNPLTWDMDSAWPAIGIRNSGTGKIIALAMAYGAHTPGIYVQHVTESSISSQTTASGPYFQGIMPLRWFKITGDGTTIRFYGSTNGVNWLFMYSETFASFMTSITDVIYVLNPNGNTNYNTGLIISSDSLS